MSRKLAVMIAGSALGCSLTTDFSGLSGGASARDGGGGSDAFVDAMADADAGIGPEAGSAGDAALADRFGCDASSETGPIAYWRMEEGAGDRIEDCRSGVGGTLSGAVGWTTGRSPSSKALAFTGGFVTVEGSDRLDLTGSFSIVAWVYFEPDHNSGVISRGDQAADHGFSVELEQNQSLSFYLASSPTDFMTTNAPGGLTKTWFQLAAVFDAGKSTAIYANGSVVILQATKVLTTPKPKLPLQIGRAWGGCCEMLGAIDEIRIFPRALTVDELQQLAKE
jgi:hypothetical protein